MNITAAQVNELRKKTGAGMMDCKKALVEANGDEEKAIEILRKKGASIAAKRAEKTANEGVILTKILNGKKAGAIVEVNCETDFVANSNDFLSFANEVLETVVEQKTSNVEKVLSADSLQQKLNEVMAKVGEKTEISRCIYENDDNGMLVDYVHPGSKLGVLLKLDNIKEDKNGFSDTAKDIAMQIAAMNPLCVNRNEVPKETIEKEIEIYKEIARKEKKPENILDKIAQGKLNKFYQENCLLEQAFIKDNSKTISDLIEEYNSNNGMHVKIDKFYRFHLGDEKK
jgi:elongation factor Ts